MQLQCTSMKSALDLFNCWLIAVVSSYPNCQLTLPAHKRSQLGVMYGEVIKFTLVFSNRPCLFNCFHFLYSINEQLYCRLSWEYYIRYVTRLHVFGVYMLLLSFVNLLAGHQE